MATESRRNPQEVGPATMVRLALEGDEPLEWVGRAAAIIGENLFRCAPGVNDPLTGPDKEKAISDGARFAMMMAEIFGEFERQATEQGRAYSAEYEFLAKLERKSAGRPVNRLDRARKGHGAAAIVERLSGEGWKIEAAIAQATSETGLSKTEINKWRAHRRSIHAWCMSLAVVQP